MTLISATRPPRPYRSSQAGILEAWNYGVRPDNPDNGPNWNKLVASCRRQSRGAIIQYEPAPYRFKTPLTDLVAQSGTYGIEHVGCGGSTSWIAAGALATTGTFLSPARYHRFNGIRFTSTSVRPVGTYMVKVTGDMTIADNPPTRTMGTMFIGCDLENGGDGVGLVDGAGSKGVCGFVWDGDGHGDARGFAAGGTVFDVNTPNGVVNEIRKVTHTETPGVASGSRPFATMRIRGAADLRCSYIESVFARNGLVVDPGAGSQTNTLWFDSCIWGSVTGTCVAITPDAAASCFGLKFVNNWCDGTTLATGTGFIITGAAAKDIMLEGLTIGTCIDGLKISAASSVIGSVDVLGGCTRGVYLTGNATDINLRVAFGNRGAANTLGWQADVGVQRFIMHTVGETLCTTGHTDNSGAVSKSLVNL